MRLILKVIRHRNDVRAKPAAPVDKPGPAPRETKEIEHQREIANTKAEDERRQKDIAIKNENPPNVKAPSRIGREKWGLLGNDENQVAREGVRRDVTTLATPVVAPASTVVVISVCEATLNVAATPLKVTLVAPARLFPRILTGRAASTRGRQCFHEWAETHGS